MQETYSWCGNGPETFRSCADPRTDETGQIESVQYRLDRLVMPGAPAINAAMSTIPIPDRGLSARRMLVLVWFEINLCWGPSLDGHASFARMPLG